MHHFIQFDIKNHIQECKTKVGFVLTKAVSCTCVVVLAPENGSGNVH